MKTHISIGGIAIEIFEDYAYLFHEGALIATVSGAELAGYILDGVSAQQEQLELLDAGFDDYMDEQMDRCCNE